MVGISRLEETHLRASHTSLPFLYPATLGLGRGSEVYGTRELGGHTFWGTPDSSGAMLILELGELGSFGIDLKLLHEANAVPHLVTPKLPFLPLPNRLPRCYACLSLAQDAAYPDPVFSNAQGHSGEGAAHLQERVADSGYAVI